MARAKTEATSVRVKAALDGLEKKLERYFITKAPYKLPERAKDWIVKLTPWLALFMVIILIPVTLLALWFRTALGLLTVGAAVVGGFRYYIGLILMLAMLLLLAAGIPALFKYERRGWRYLLYATFVNALSVVVDWVAHPAAVLSLIWGAFWAVIGVYLIFQIRDRYQA